MVAPLAVLSGVSAAVNLASGISGYLGGQSAAKAAERAAKEQARLDALHTQEMVKRMEYENIREQSLAASRSAASGIGGATMDMYLDEMERVGVEEVDWLKKVGAARYSATVEEGKTAGSIARSQSEQSLWGGIGSALSTVQSWWS
jgi:hypothetical protein